MGNIVYRMHELGITSACMQKRSFAYALKSREESYMAKAMAVKQTLRELFDGTLKKEDAEKVLKERFEAIPYPSEEQRAMHAQDSLAQIMRYYTCEKRHPNEAKAQIVELKSSVETMPVLVSPDYFFLYDDVLEVVKIKVSKPSLSQASAVDDIGLYAMLCYAREMMPKGAAGTIKASYYFLAKKNDSKSAKKPNFDTDFFNTTGGLNIVSLQEYYTNDGSAKESDLDVHFKKVIDTFLDGVPKEKCTEDDCQKCDLFDICKYQEPPLAIKKTPVVRSVKDITLTDAQAEAIEYERGVCRINAGAGAGKTLVIALRTATLLSKGVKPEELCLVTFTKAGAEEMRSRIKLYVDDMGLDVDVDKITIQTFNAFGDEIIQREYAKVGFTAPPTVIDDVERSHIIATILNEAVKRPYVVDGVQSPNPLKRLDFRNFTMASKYAFGAVPAVKKVFDVMKAERLSAYDVDEIYNRLGFNGIPKETVAEIAKLYDEYDEKLKKENLLEFADQETLVFDLLHQEPFYFERFGFKHITVDEFQDTNERQLEIVKMLRDCPSFESLMIVGDDSQAIFGFRNTSPDFIINFDKYMGEEVDDIYLLENHRSTPEIIDYANKINANNLHRVVKDLISTRPHGKKVVAKGFHSTKDEREYVLDGIEKHIESGVKPEDIAVICYTKYELQEMAALLASKGIQSVMLNPEPFIENSRVRAAIAYANAVRDSEDTKDVLTYANALIGGGVMDMSAEEVEALIAKTSEDIAAFNAIEDASEKKTAFMDALKAIDRNEDEVYENFLETLERKPEVGAICDYLDEFYLYGSGAAFRRNHDYPGVVLTTAHSSKGLEWNIVYNMISKYDEESIGTYSALREERRRLLFVSATRARDELYITSQYVAYGKKGSYTYNGFLVESYKALGMEFSIGTIEVEREMIAVAQKAARAEERKKALEKEPELASLTKKKSKKASAEEKPDVKAPKKAKKPEHDEPVTLEEIDRLFAM